MAKELPYFRFEPSEWDNGNIQMCSRESKGLFIDMCSIYWSRVGELPYALALQKLCNGSKDALKELIEHEIIGVVDGQIVIEFLDEQLLERGQTSEKRREAAQKRWSDASALQMESKSNAKRIEENRREEKREEEKIGEGENFLFVKAKYIHERVKRIHDLKLYFELMQQWTEIEKAGWGAKILPFMKENPAAIFDEDSHLYNSFRKFATRPIENNGKKKSFDIHTVKIN